MCHYAKEKSCWPSWSSSSTLNVLWTLSDWIHRRPFSQTWVPVIWRFTCFSYAQNRFRPPHTHSIFPEKPLLNAFITRLNESILENLRSCGANIMLTVCKSFRDINEHEVARLASDKLHTTSSASCFCPHRPTSEWRSESCLYCLALAPWCSV